MFCLISPGSGLLSEKRSRADLHSRYASAGLRKNRASVGGNAVSNPPPAEKFETQGAGKDFFRLNYFMRSLR